MKIKIWGYNIQIFKPITNKERLYKWQAKMRRKGRCILCGEPTKMNKRTDKHYNKCEKHRLRENELKRK